MKDTIILIIAVLGHLVYLFAGIRVIEEVSGVSIIDKETSEEDLEWNTDRLEDQRAAVKGLAETDYEKAKRYYEKLTERQRDE